MIKDRYFWMVQIAVVLIAVAHSYVEAQGLLPHFETFYFVPITIFFAPVIYAALNFGVSGAVITAAWAAIISVPELFLWHSGMQRWGVLTEMSILSLAAVLVGYRADREMTARKKAAAAAVDLHVSEKKHRSLFEMSLVPVFVVSQAGIIIEANPAATAVFERSADSLRGMTIADLVGVENANNILSRSLEDQSQPETLVIRSSLGRDMHFKPAILMPDNTRDVAEFHLVLRDVTEERNRQAGLKAYAASVTQAQEDERKRMARELHDDIIQSLMLLHRNLDSAEASPQPLPPQTLSKLQEGKTTIEEVVKRLRGFATALRPPTLDDLGMVASIRRLTADLGERAGLDTRFKVVGEPRRFPALAELGIFRIAQEALRNVERHACAHSVSVTITFTESDARLDVTDDGSGFAVPNSVAHLAATQHAGLLGMQERAELLGGKLRLQSSPCKGTSVSVSVPDPHEPVLAPSK